MLTNATVLGSLTRAVIEFAVERGIDAAVLLRAGALDARALEEPGARIPAQAHAAIWAEVEERLGSHGLGLAFARSIHAPRAFGVVVLRDMMAPSFGEALRRHCRDHRLLKGDVHAQLIESNGAATIYLATPSGRLDATPAAAEAAIAPYALHARAWTGQRVDPLEVRFEHTPPPRDQERYEQMFQCPVHFGQPVTAIRFSRETFELPLVHAQRDVFEYLDRTAEEAVALLPQGSASEATGQVITDLLARGDVSPGAVARRLGVGVRTLQRRLQAEGLCFQDVLDRVRHKRALALLLDPDLAVASVSDRLGFSDPRAFRRAFARWTGMSPDQYRRTRLG